MDVELISFEGCPNVELARQSIDEAARRSGVVVQVRHRVVADAAEAVAAGMRGSPTVLVAGHDVAPAGGNGGSLSCRLDLGLDVDRITSALVRAREGDAGADLG